MTKTQNRKWWEQTAPAYSIVNAIADVLDLEEEMEQLEQVGKYPPAKPGALGIAPLKAALIDHDHYTHSMTDGLGLISSRAFARARMGPIHYVCTL
jgi:hypothetical protein